MDKRTAEWRVSLLLWSAPRFPSSFGPLRAPCSVRRRKRAQPPPAAEARTKRADALLRAGPSLRRAGSTGGGREKGKGVR